MNNPWHTLQTTIRNRLLDQAYFIDVPILTEDAGDIEAAIQTALIRGAALTTSNAAALAGVAVLVLTPRAEGTETTRRHMLTDTTVRLVVFERGVVNRGTKGLNKPALDVLWQIVSMIQGWRPNAGAVPARLEAWDSEESPEEDGTLLQYFADFIFRQSTPLES